MLHIINSKLRSTQVHNARIKKKYYITPIPKMSYKTNKTKKEKYRPISILSNLKPKYI